MCTIPDNRRLTQSCILLFLFMLSFFFRNYLCCPLTCFFNCQFLAKMVLRWHNVTRKLDMQQMYRLRLIGENCGQSADRLCYRLVRMLLFSVHQLKYSCRLYFLIRIENVKILQFTNRITIFQVMTISCRTQPTLTDGSYLPLESTWPSRPMRHCSKGQCSLVLLSAYEKHGCLTNVGSSFGWLRMIAAGLQIDWLVVAYLIWSAALYATKRVNPSITCSSLVCSQGSSRSCSYSRLASRLWLHSLLLSPLINGGAQLAKWCRVRGAKG
uniref:Uncharacterized protein n=1 Tax=Arundo donax TaxID=35708 RepID=A0A0A9GB79_ARUDO